MLSDVTAMDKPNVLTSHQDRRANVRLKPSMGTPADPQSVTTIVSMKPSVDVSSHKRRANGRLTPIGAPPGASICDGQDFVVPQGMNAIAGNDGAHPNDASHIILSPIIAALIQANRLHDRWVQAHVSLVLTSKAICRWHTSGDKEAASKLFDSGEFPDELAYQLLPFLGSLEHFEPRRKEIEKRLVTLVRQLPIHEWADGVKGLGELSLAKMVGCAGDIGSYRNPACLWKRMGLAVIDGERQRKCADKDKAIIHGYDPRRRALMYVIGDTLLKGNKGHYKQIYDERKAYTMSREVNPITTKIHAHKEAMRYMTKRLLRDLWVAWRRQTASFAEPIATVSAANNSETTTSASKSTARVLSRKRRATHPLKPTHGPPVAPILEAAE